MGIAIEKSGIDEEMVNQLLNNISNMQKGIKEITSDSVVEEGEGKPDNFEKGDKPRDRGEVAKEKKEQKQKQKQKDKKKQKKSKAADLSETESGISEPFDEDKTKESKEKPKESKEKPKGSKEKPKGSKEKKASKAEEVDDEASTSIKEK